MSVATIILEQLGGNKFIAMTGAKNFVDCGNALMFMLPKAKDGINKVRITLTPNDEYDVEFFKLRGIKITLVSEVKGIYFDRLQEVFTEHTGLYTHL